MPAASTEPSAGTVSTALRGENGPRALIVLILAVLATAAVLMVLAVDRIQTTLLERDAVAKGLRWTDGLLGSLETVETVFDGGTLSGRDRRTIDLAFRLADLKAFLIFDRDGRVIAASDPAELGRINVSGYWASEVLRGSPHAAIETIAAADGGAGGVVAETYVPVYGSGDRSGRVIGAFEAYLDVSESAASYRRIGQYASTAGVALIAAAGAIAVAFVRRSMSFRLERERMLADARQAAEASSAAKSRFLATVSHEIRTPMNGVLATAELLASTCLAADQRAMVSVIRRSGDALLELLNQILDQSRIEAGKLEILPEPFVLEEVLQGVVDVMRPAAAAKGLKLTLEFPQVLPPVVSGDAPRLRQILLNLCGNAVKFTEEGQVSLSAATAGGGNVVIRVADTGIGIAPEALSRLFDPFEQADASTTRRYGGTGLGLAIAQELAELMGGTLSVTSAPGSGSTFTLTLPLPPAEPRSSARPATATPVMLGLQVLVADDDPTNRWVIGRQLERLGCGAGIFEDGVAALRAWRAEPDRWQAVVTDWHMPGLDGLGLLNRLHDEPEFAAHRPMLVMMTASGLPEEIERAQRAGAEHVLVKPVSLDRLAATFSATAVRAPREKPGCDDPGAAPVLDTTDLEALCGGDRATLVDVLRRFELRLNDGMAALAAAADPDARRAAAHALRGAALSIGALALAAACEALEAGEDRGKGVAAVEAQASRFRDALRDRTGEGE